MECALCFNVAHPACMTDYGVDGPVRMDLPNLWECPRCIKAGVVKAEADPDQGEEPASKMIKSEPVEAKTISTGSDATLSGYQLFSVKGTSDQSKHELRTQLAGQILSASTHPHKKPQFVFRPPPVQQMSAEEIYERRKTSPDVVDLTMERGIMLPVFKMLDTTELAKCVLVCKTWCKIIQDPALW
jgi:hypothetical protein